MKRILAVIALPLVVALLVCSPYLYSSISNGNVFAISTLTNLSPICGAGGFQIKIAGCPPGGGGGGLLPYSAIAVVLSGGTTPVYIPLGGGGLGSTTEASVQTEVAAVTTFSNVCVVLSSAPGGGNSLVVTLRDNAANTTITLTISGAAVSACDTTHTVTNVANDLMDWSLVPSGVIALFSPNIQLLVQTGTLTAGTINAGSANQTAYYPGAGNAISGGGPGTAGQCWTSNGAGSAPTFQACSGGGGSVSFAQPYATDSVNFFFPAFQVVKPLDTTWINQNGASRSTTNGSVFIAIPNTSTTTDNITCRVLANASSPYTITIGGLMNGLTSSAGTALYVTAGDSGSGKQVIHGQEIYSSNVSSVLSVVGHMTTPTSNYAVIQSSYAIQSFGPVWYRLQDDGTNMLYSVSRDGINFVQIFIEADTAFLPIQPANEVGFCGENIGTLAPQTPLGITAFHMSLTSP